MKVMTTGVSSGVVTSAMGLSTGGALTTVVRTKVLLSGARSATELVTTAVLVMKPPSAGAVPVRTISGAGPTGRLASVQVKVAPAARQLQPEVWGSPKSTTPSSWSVRTTAVAALGPVFVTAKV